MKPGKSIFKLPAIIACLLPLAGTAGAQTYSESQKIERSFAAGPETRLDLSNKYGTVHVIPWKKDSVKISIDLFIRSTSTARMEKLKKDVDFEFTDTRYYITANTRFGSPGGNFFSDLKSLSGSLLSSKNEVRIDYTVLVPPGLNINLSNKYGDIYIDDMKGSVSINLSNGDIKANSLLGETSISLNFGNGIVNELSNARLNISYADIEIQKAGQLRIESKSSKIRIREVEILDAESRRDKYTISRIDNLFGESWFTDIWLYRADDEINFNPRYGALKVDSIPEDFSFININTEYADLDLTFARSANYQLEILRHNDVMLRLPESYGELQVVEQEEDGEHLSGLIGPVQNPAGRVRITAPKKCIINIQIR